MNDRIKELLIEAGFKIFGNKVVAADNGSSGDATSCSKKFANLIVRECAHLVGGYVKENEFGPATDVKEAYEEITKHFGVEE